MTRLDYNEDNYLGGNSRGTRYRIIVDGNVMFDDVAEQEVDHLCDEISRKIEMGIYEDYKVEWD